MVFKAGIFLSTAFPALNLRGGEPATHPQPPVPASRLHRGGPSLGARGIASAPALSYATYLGSAKYRVNALAVGPDGTAYVAGVALASAADIDLAGTRPGEGTAFVARISNDGSQIIYFTFLGTDAVSEARAIAVDVSGNAYVTGQTRSTTFPVIEGLQSGCSRNASGQCTGDAFVAKLNTQGSIVYSTYLGGSGEDAGNAISIDANEDIYVAGRTTSTDSPTFKPEQSSIGGGQDAFIAKISADGSHLLFATYLGGNGDDESRGIAVDATGNIFVTGSTTSTDFPVHYALQPSCVLNSKSLCPGEAFVAKLSADGSTFLYSTYLGGSGGDAANAIAIDPSGSAYITGITNSADFPVFRPLEPRAASGRDAFVSRLSADGESLVFSTYLGGAGANQGNAITLDQYGNVFVSGWTSSLNFPTFDPVQSACRTDTQGVCSVDVFVAAMDSTGATIKFATYLGGSGVDDGRGIAVDAQGAIYLAGATTSVDFPEAKLVQPSESAGNQSPPGGSPANGVSGGAFVAKITGLILEEKESGTGSSDAKNSSSQLPDPPTACTGTTTNWLGGTGNWSNAAMWSTGVVPNSTSTNVCIDDGNAAASVVTLDIAAAVGRMTIDSGDSLTIGNSQSLVVAGNISNAGQIQISAAANNTFLSISGAVSLSGAGTVTLSMSDGGVAVINESGSGAVLTNVNNTIQGRGQIGNNGLSFVNQTAGIVNGNVAGAALLLNTNSIANQGLLESTSAFLQISATTNNSGGTISASGTGVVQFLSGATIQGGTLATASGGVLGVAAGTTITLDGATHGTLTISGAYTGPNNSTTILVGTINNTGAILVNATANNTFLSVSAGVSLTGGGTVTLSTTGGGIAIINESVSGAILTNANNTIQGVGQIGNNGLALVNQAGGIIDANVAGTALLLNSNGVTNLGLLEATNGGVLQTSTSVNNQNATITANGMNSTVQFLNGTTVQAGTLSTLNGGILGVAANQTTTLDGTTHGALINAGTYTGPNNSSTVLLGTINNAGAIQVVATANNTFLSISGNVSLTGAGTVTLSTSGGGTPIINESGSNAVLTNVGNTIQGIGQIGNNGLALVNQSTINANHPAGVLTINAPRLTTQGPPQPASGARSQITNRAIANAGGTIKVDGSMGVPAGFTVNGGTLSGPGTISGSVIVGPSAITQPGDTPLPGVLTISGNGAGSYTQGPTDALNVVIGGTAPGTQYSQLKLTGAANLNGAVNVSLANGFTPVAGTQFTILSAASVTGQFSTPSLPGLPAGLLWSVIYNPTSVVLVAAAPASIAVTPANASIAVNATLQFTATATFANGSTQNVTGAVTWASSTPVAATITSTGLATGVTGGKSTTISATLGSVVGSTGLTITSTGTPALTRVSPNTGGQGQQNLSIAITGQATHFAQATTTASFGAGITVVSLTVNSATSATAVVDIAQSATLGAHTVTLTSGTEVASLTNGFTVTALSLTSIAVTPNPPPSIAIGATEQFTATGTFSDGSTQNLTSTATWASSNAGFASISNAAGTRGLATGVAVGMTSISASVNGVTSPGVSLTATATAPTLTSITVAPLTMSIAIGATQTFTATGHFSDGSSGAVTVNWTSSNIAIATINAAGLASGVSAGGPITITATSTQTPSIHGTAQLTVTATAPTLTSITVAPLTMSIAIGATQTFTATGHFSDGSSGAVTVSWTSSNVAIATINAAGVASGVSAGGPITITATSTQTPSIHGTAQLTVTATALVSIAVTPVNPSAAAGTTLQFHATGTYADASTKDITTAVAWSSSNTRAATINAAGLATLIAGGQSTISATLGAVSGNTLLTISSAPFTLTLAPPPAGQPAVATVAPGSSIAFGLVLTSAPGFTGTVQFACTTTNPTITYSPTPISVTLSPTSPTEVAIVLNTFCQGAAPSVPAIPGNIGGGFGLLLMSLVFGGAALSYRRRRTWALASAVLAMIVLGSAACGGLPKGPNGPTQPGLVTVTVTASANGTTATAPPIELIIK